MSPTLLGDEATAQITPRSPDASLTCQARVASECRNLTHLGLQYYASCHNLLPTMRSILALLLLATTATSIPAAFRFHNAPEYPLPVESPEGFDWNLQEMRLVQLAPDAEPVWMTELEKVTHILLTFEVSLMKVDPRQSCGTEIYGYVRIYAMTTSLTSQSLSTEAEDLGSLSPVTFQWPGMFHISDFAYKLATTLHLPQLFRNPRLPRQ